MLKEKEKLGLETQYKNTQEDRGSSPSISFITMDVEAEVNHLVKEIERLGTKGPDGKVSVKYPCFDNLCFFCLQVDFKWTKIRKGW